MTISNRRVVTGLDPEGRSCVLFDGPVDVPKRGALVWRSDNLPASNAGTADAADRPVSFDLLQGGGATFLLHPIEPGREPFMHATNTLDYIVVLRGEVVLRLETGEVVLHPGDLLVDRGIVHGWSATGAETALIAVITLPAEPVGKGATV